MSFKKKIGICLCMLVAFFATTFLGCDKDVPVERIYFNLEENQDHIVLLVGDEIDLKDYVEILPTYATNKKFTITSSNEQVVEISDTTISALKQGSSLVTITANDNERKQDAVTIVVEGAQTTLTSPQNLTYDSSNQKLTFDSVINASGYTVKVNGTEYNLGNSTSIALTSLENAFDNVLKISVKANAPTYSHAIVSSGYSNEMKIYQASKVENLKVENGILTFAKTKNDYVCDVYLGNDKIASDIEATTLNLDLDETFAEGQHTLSVVAKNVAGLGDVTYYESLKTNKNINVLPNIDAEISGTTLSWETYANLLAEITINGETITTGANNLNLAQVIENFDTLSPSATAYQVALKRKFDEDNKVENVVFINKTTTLKYNILETTTFSVDKNVVKWTEVENSSAFVINITRDGTKVLNTTSQMTQFDLSNLEAGVYNFEITAVSNGLKNNIYYFSSRKANKVVTKKAVVENLKLENYIFSFTADGETEYQIYLDNQKYETLSSGSFDLTNKEFTAGTHKLKVCALGNQTDTVDANISNEISFVQLEKIEEITIANGTASVSLSAINENANVSLIVYQGVSQKIVKVGTSYTFNTTDETDTSNYLSAGDYSISVKVEGDGIATFSYREKTGSELKVVETANKTFKVLSTPTISAFDKATAKVTATATDGTVKFVLDNLGAGTQTGNDCTFALSAGQSADFKLQTLGNGSTTLNSKFTQSYTVTKLETPVLSFDKTSNVVSKSTVDNASGYVSNKTDYNFTSNYDFDEGDNVFTIYAEANDNDGTNFYINSNEDSLTVKKIKKATTFNLSKAGELTLQSAETTKFGLTLTLHYNGTDHIFVSNETGNTLTCGSESLSYTFVQGKYSVTLINSNYEYILKNFGSFNAKVKYTSQDEKIINSDDSDVSETFSIVDAVSIARDGQNLYFAINTTQLLTNPREFYVLANGKEFAVYADGIKEGFTLDETNQKIILPYEKLCTLADAEVATVQIVTKQDGSLANRSNIIKAKRAPSVVWNYVKDNAVADNSAYVSFDVLSGLSYAISYSVQIGDLIPAQNEVGGKISYCLDELALEAGEAECSAQVLTTAKDGEVEMFNSLVATKGITKLGTVTEIKVKGTILTFVTNNNAQGYEIYKQNGSVKEKLSTELLMGNTFELTTVGKYYVKAIATAEGDIYSNSNYSEEIEVQRLSDPEIAVEDGKLKFTFDSNIITLAQDADSTIKLIVNRADSAVDFETKNEEEFTLTYDDTEMSLVMTSIEHEFTTKTTTLTVLPENFLQYTGNEKLQLQYVVDGKIGTVYCLNSYKTTIENLIGLVSPNSVHINKDSADGGVIDNVSWAWNNVSPITYSGLSVKYMMSIYTSIDDAEVVFSTEDARLKYKDAGGNLVSYSTISVTTCPFPACYGEEGDDDYFEFGAGEYEISIRACVNSNSYPTNKYCISKESTRCEVTIMSAPELTFDANGCAVWVHNVKATSYELKMTKGTNSLVDIIIVDGSPADFSYDFATSVLNMDGMVDLQIKAISTSANVLNSQYSTASAIYKIEQATNLSIDDGTMILTAKPYFTSAKIIFTNKQDNSTREIVFDYSDEFQTNCQQWMVAWALDGGLNVENIKSKMNALPYQEIALDLSGDELNLEAGDAYTATVQLIGGKTIGAYSLVNSQRNTSALGDLEMTKLKSTANTIEYGKLKFVSNESYHTNSSNSSIVKINYHLGSTTVVRNFWDNMAIYHIIVKAGASETLNDIYALDWYNFNEYKDYLTENTDYVATTDLGDLRYYVKYGDIYFNVFNENTINLNYDNLWYYSTTMTISGGDISWESTGGYRTINLDDYSLYNIKIEVLGGDRVGTTSPYSGYLTASSLEILPFVRYIEQTAGVKNGKLSLLNQKITVDETTDYPVYRINLTSGGTQTIYAYYKDKLAEAKLATGIADATYVEIEETEIDDITYYLVDISDYLTANTAYSVTVKTIAGGTLGMDVNYINSREPQTVKLIKQWTINDFTIEAGKLKLDMSKVDVDTNNVAYGGIYELRLTYVDEQNDVHTYIQKLTADAINAIYNNSNHTIVYDMQNEFPFDYSFYNDEQDDHSGSAGIVEGKEYSITIQAINSDNFINSKQSNALTFKKPYGVGEIKVENGKLVWTKADNYNGTGFYVEIRFTKDDKEKIVSISLGDVLEYTLGDNSYSTTTGENIQLVSGIEYSLNVYAVKDGYVHSNYATITTSRLNQVYAPSIKAENGILTWGSVENASGYEVTIGESKYTMTINSFDMAEVDAGTYNVSVRAIGGDTYISSINSSSVEITKLTTVDGVKFENGNLVWNSIANVTQYGVKIGTADEVVVTTNCYSDTIESATTVKVRALGSTSKQVNGDYSAEISVSSATPDAVSNLHYDEDQYAISWQMTEFLDADTVVIKYNLKKSTDSGLSSTIDAVEERMFKQDGELYVKKSLDDGTTWNTATKVQTYEEGGTTYYMLPLTVVGQYLEINATILRVNTTSSAVAYYEDESKEHLSFTFAPFEYGCGTAENPYAVATFAQFVNINKFNSNNFKLINFINMDGVDFEDYREDDEIYIIKEFSGYIDGNHQKIGKGIIANNIWELNFENVTDFALFGSLNGAKIDNLTVGDTENLYKLTFSFAKDISNMVSLSLIAGETHNSTLTAVKVANAKFEVLSNDAKINANLRISALTLCDEASNFDNCDVNFECIIDANIVNANKTVYVSGMIAEATNSKIAGGTVNFTLSKANGNSNLIVTYCGAVVATYNGSSTATKAIQDVTVSLTTSANTKIKNCGGVVGYAKSLWIDGCTSTSIVLHSTEYCFGGIAGETNNCKIEYCTTSISNFEWKTNLQQSDEYYVGGICGILSFTEISDCETDNNRLETDKVNKLMGIYGIKDEDSQVSNCD